MACRRQDFEGQLGRLKVAEATATCNAMTAFYLDPDLPAASKWQENYEDIADVGATRTACELALNRPPTPEEIVELSAYEEKHGFANLCRLLLNSNEFMFVN